MTNSPTRLGSPSLPVARQQYLAPFLILLSALIAFFFEQQLGEYLIYKRPLVDQGEWWRFISAHFFHTNLYHFLLNIAALTLLWALQGHLYTIKSYLSVFFFSAFISCLGVHYFSPNLSQYVGLSGALHGIFIWSALQEIKHKEKVGYLLLLGIVLKISFEQFYGASADLSEIIAAKVAINAHLWGVIGGTFMFLMIWIVNRSLKRARI
ncbi:MAG: rhomboid family GlyGly-CTERM serine protease [Oleiphilaceae bacterium]|jgi:rhomboid family GlyGly-CTERM serine protease